MSNSPISNPTRREGRLYVVSAASGAGKTSLLRALAERRPRIVLSMSYTTRFPRPGEREGVDYHFVDRETFAAMSRRGEWLESAEVFGNEYGTSAAGVEARRTEGWDVVLEIDWQGAKMVRERVPDTRSIFILPPSLEVLRTRLEGRGTDSSQAIARRLAAARNETLHWREYDYIVINAEFAPALAALESIFSGQGKPWRRGRPGLGNFIARLLAAGGVNA